MKRHQSAMGRHRRSTVAAVVFVPAATILALGADSGPIGEPDPHCCTQATAAPAPRVSYTGVEVVALPVDTARATRSNLRIALPAGVAPEKGLQVETILTARAVSKTFPEILDIGGVRADSLKWHPNGMAIDVMIPNYTTPEGKDLGDRVVAYVLERADRLGVNHVIFRQEIYSRDGSRRMMADRGGPTANHYDHVHIATNGGGFPTGRETYLL